MLITVAFLATAFCFFSNSDDKINDSGVKIVDAKPFISNKNVRDPVLHPLYTRHKMTYSCNECHQNFQTKEEAIQKNLIGEHSGLVLDHGQNNRCVNCHHPENKEALLAQDGSEIPFSQSQNLCAKCHGPKFREWTKGIHGKLTGFWDSTKGSSNKTQCLYCHNPHSPKFKPLQPAPGPSSGKSESTKGKH